MQQRGRQVVPDDEVSIAISKGKAWLKRTGWLLALGGLAFFIYMSSYVRVDQGWNAVVYRFGAANRVMTEGANWKLPFIESYKWFDMRLQSNPEDMEASSYDNMAVKVKLSQTWQITDTFEFAKQFTNKEYFETAILDRRFREIAKDVIPKYTATNLMRDRSKASTEIDRRMAEELKGFPMIVRSSQIEDVDPPKEFRDAVIRVEQAQKAVEEERHKTEQQKIQTQREVQTREAQAKGIEAVARAEANAVEWKGAAEAKAATLVGDAIAKNSRLVEYEYAKRWGGNLPTMMMPAGTSPSMLFGMPPATTAAAAPK